MEQPTRPLRADRTSVMLSGVLHRRDRAEASTHRVVNLSATGARMTGVEGLAVGEIVAVTIGLVENALAQIVRTDEKGAAIRFREPIDVARARTRRTSGSAAVPRAGWLAEMQDAYHR